MRAAFLVSGRGSNMEAVLRAVKNGYLNIETAAVLSDKESPPALRKAEEYNVSAEFVDPGSLSREEYDDKLLERLEFYKVDFVIMAGFMRILEKKFIKSFPYKIVNIHPSLLPSFRGLNAPKQALEYGVKYSGCTVHFVEEEVDAGPIIAQAVVPVKEDDTVESLSSRILAREHKIYPWVIKKISQGKVLVKGRKVHILRGGS